VNAGDHEIYVLFIAPAKRTSYFGHGENQLTKTMGAGSRHQKPKVGFFFGFERTLPTPGEFR
jgi:hypothetical protein